MELKCVIVASISVLCLSGCSSISNPEQLATSLGSENELGEVLYSSRCFYVMAGEKQKYANFNRGLCALYSSRKFIFLDEGERIFGIYQKRQQSKIPQVYKVEKCLSVSMSKSNFLAMKQFSCQLKGSGDSPSGSMVVVMMKPDLDLGMGVSNQKTNEFFKAFIALGIPEGDEVDYINIDTSDYDYYVPYYPYKK